MPESFDLREFISAIRSTFSITPASAPTVTMMPLLRADPEAKNVYLDLNHWIELAKVRKGVSTSTDYRSSYERLIAATASGEVAVPLSAAL